MEGHSTGARVEKRREVVLVLYVCALVALAAGLIAFLVVAQVVWPALVSPASFQWPALLLLAALGLLAERYRIAVHAGAEVSAGFLAFFLAAAIVGPLGSIAVAVVGQAWSLRGSDWLRGLCFASTAAVTAGGTALFYWAAVAGHGSSGIMVAAIGLLAGILFHFLNYLTFVPVVWLRRGIRPKDLWVNGFQPVIMFHLFFLAMSLALISIYNAYAPKSGTGATLYSTLMVVLCLLPVVGLIYAFRAYAQQRDLAVRNERLAVRNERLALQAVGSQITALDLKDDYTAQHSAAVAQWATDIAKAMRLPEHRVNLTHLAGLVHDVGKIGIPDELLKSSHSLDSEDWALIESHCFHGHKILGRIDQFGELAEVVLHHHERYDGNGYPHGLAGRDIPMESRIIAVADAYSAMISQRPYGPPLPTIVAEAELEFRKGSQFDPEVVDYFLDILRKNGDGYRLGMKADFRMEVQDVRFLRELPVEPPEGAPAEPAPVVRVRERKGLVHQDTLAEEARRHIREHDREVRVKAGAHAASGARAGHAQAVRGKGGDGGTKDAAKGARSRE
jgi:HD-GYP domain-containing protein (c-di-GMP phosphodiesterase class II)